MTNAVISIIVEKDIFYKNDFHQKSVWVGSVEIGSFNSSVRSQ